MRNRPPPPHLGTMGGPIAGRHLFSTDELRPKLGGAAEVNAPEVGVVAVEQRDIPVYREWIGTLDGMVNSVRAGVRTLWTVYRKEAVPPTMFGAKQAFYGTRQRNRHRRQPRR
jgi:hypothetical protein